MSNRFASNNPDLHAGSGNIDSNIDLFFGVEVDSADGAIAAKEGYVFITKAGVAALTLPLPTAGMPSVGGDDGKVLTIQSTTANAHTVRLTKSTKSGRPEPFRLLPVHKKLVANLLGWKRKDGTRLFRKCYFSVARKNAKTQIAAALFRSG